MNRIQMSVVLRAALLTIQEIVDCHSYAVVKSSGIGRGLKGEPELHVAGLPVVKGGHYFVVLEVFFYCTT